MELRKYQENDVGEIRSAMAKYRRVLFQAQTGYGKTVVFSYIAISAQKYNRKVLILSDRTEILTQNGKKLSSFGADVDYVSPKHRKVPASNIVAMQGTYSKEFNKAIMEEYNIAAIITKESGESGGAENKINAALELDIPVVLIKRPKVEKLANHIMVRSIEELEKTL